MRDGARIPTSHHGIEKSTPKGASVHFADAEYCQLGDIRKDFVRPSKLDRRNNPSGKLVGEFAAKGEKPP